MTTRLAKFLLLIALISGALEIFVRVNSDSFFALSDKLLLKVEILKRNPDTRILCLGTSRFLDAIDERQFSKEIERLTGEKIKVINAATTGSQGARFAYFAEIAAKNKHLTHVILEATPPALQDGKLNFPADDSSETSDDLADSGAGKKFADRAESYLQKWITEHVALAKYRKALRPATLEKFFVLHTSGRIAPNTWSRKGIVRNLFGPSNVEITDSIADALRPVIINRDTVEPPTPESLQPSIERKHLLRISEIFAASDIKVIWVAPPVIASKSHSNHNGKHIDSYRDIAHRFDAEIYAYVNDSFPEKYLRDPTHLNANGRYLFTTLLARDLAEKLVAETE